MEEWKEYKLEEICMKITDGSHSSPRAQEYGYPMFSVKDMLEYGFDYSKCKYISKEDFLILKQNGCVPQKGDVLVAKDGSYLKQIFVCKQTKEEGILSSIAIFRPNELVDSYFLCYLLKSPQVYNYIANNCVSGSALPRIVLKDFKSVKLQIPSKETQINIVSKLKSLDDKIECNCRINDNFTFSFLLLTCFVLWLLKLINDNLQQQAQALYKSWFIDFEPFQNGTFIDSELGMIPKGWIVGDIYNYVDVIYGAPYKSSMFNENKEGLPLIRIRDLKTNAPQFFTPEILPNTEYIDAGDIVAGMDAEFAPYLWLGEKGVLNQRCCKFKAKNNSISNYYILFLVKPKLEYVQSYKTGTTVSHLGKSDIDRFKFIIPPLDVVLAFSKKVNYMKEEVVNRARESRRLSQLRDTLLPRLMSGELKVNELTL